MDPKSSDKYPSERLGGGTGREERFHEIAVMLPEPARTTSQRGLEEERKTSLRISESNAALVTLGVRLMPSSVLKRNFHSLKPHSVE